MKKLFNKAVNSIKNVATDVADGTLSSIHFVAISVADTAEVLECKLHKGVDPEQIRRDRMMHTCHLQECIIERVNAAMRKGEEVKAFVFTQFETKEVMTDNFEDMTVVQSQF